MSLEADAVAFRNLISLWRDWEPQHDTLCQLCREKQSTVLAICATCFPNYLLRRLMNEIKAMSRVAGEGEHMVIKAEDFYDLEEILTAATRKEDGQHG